MQHQTTKNVYAFVWSYYQEHGFGPTQQEIAEGCELARSGVSRHLDKLARWGWLTREDGKARGPDRSSRCMKSSRSFGCQGFKVLTEMSDKKVTIDKNKCAKLIANEMITDYETINGGTAAKHGLHLNETADLIYQFILAYYERQVSIPRSARLLKAAI